ncbi:hypothetical protein E3AUHO_12490 [Klebsiella pneumoniae subsp. pneumoniae]|uniref:Glycosyltransferase n=1 Tax=Klebsiella pneumoniae TaxID=573 RepID=A0A1C3SYQ3_KLEPN|nr:hypothetical protein [Klebsiella pneumoniae]BDA88563.1 hypothetical protein E3AUHO_12490 [Klebsiella pneumoniae subsp. pneumoniae]EIX9358064.1 hypothetical protein [Klebsiella pneumoniae]EMB5614120.1 hypothetical protein [Klebsiella pneumoniae]MBD3115713.1 hypothetical protein [Klebsiella pneumoniae]MBD3120956.1 hypothetical protein [Klebsiella pneumoniae]
MNSILLVILYNKNFNQSSTLESLLHSKYDGDLLIFNNGPLSLDITDSFYLQLKNKFRFVGFNEDCSNRPLSVIYNDFVKEYKYDRYFFFDDDTNVTDEFLSSKNNNSIDVSLPIIKSITDKKAYYPRVNNVVCEHEIFLNDSDYVISIGSGLMITSKLIDKFNAEQMTLFDERFSLYGVDFSLFRRIKLLRTKNIQINIEIAGELCHSLSRVDGRESTFRIRERSIDVVLTKILYPTENAFINYLSIFKVLIKTVARMDLQGLSILSSVIKHRAHPRSISYLLKRKYN